MIDVNRRRKVPHYRYSKRSAMCLSQAHPDLQAIFHLAIQRSPVDFGVIQTARSFDEQLRYFNLGKSKLDPRNPDMLKKAKHVLTDTRDTAEAADFYVYTNQKTYKRVVSFDQVHLGIVWGVLSSCSVELYEEGKIDHLLRWGGDWDRDGVGLYDQEFRDLGHVELIEVKRI